MRRTGALLAALLLAACSTTTGSPSQFMSAAVTPSPPTPSPLSSGPTNSPEAASPTSDDAPARPPVGEVRQPGGIGVPATVLQPRLAVRDFAGNAYDVWAELRAGTEVMITLGPLSNDGLDWYEVIFSSIAGDPDIWGNIGGGWVAAGRSGGEATSLQIGAPRCPEVITANDIDWMSTYARLACLGTGSHEVTGVINGCSEYYLPPDEPAWLLSACLNLGNEDGTATGLFLHFPPELLTVDVEQGDIVRLVGHVDDARAAQCDNLVSAEPPIPALVVDAYSTLACRGRFVVTELEITGHA